MKKKSRLRAIYSGSLIDANCLKDLLKEKHIKAILQDEVMGATAPWAISAGGVKVMVTEDDFTEAQIIVRNFLQGNRQD